MPSDTLKAWILRFAQNDTWRGTLAWKANVKGPLKKAPDSRFLAKRSARSATKHGVAEAAKAFAEEDPHVLQSFLKS